MNETDDSLALKEQNIWKSDTFMWGITFQNKTLSLQHCPTEEMLANYFTKPLQGSLFICLRNHIMGAEFEDGNPQTHRSVLGHDDMNLEAIERDQNENGRDQNKVKNNKKLFPPREQNNDYKTMEKVLTPREHNNENARNETMDGGEHTRKKERKKEQQMTYREALLGLDNSEMSSDFKIYSVCEALRETLRKRLRSV